MEFSKYLNKLFDFLFPPHLVCHACDKEAIVNAHGICKDCESKIRTYSSVVGATAWIDGFTSGLCYNDAVKKAVHSFKFNGALYKKEFFVHYMTVPSNWEFDFVIPVPLHPKRERQRGYNQSKVLAKELCKRYNLKLGEGFLSRIRNTQKQSLTRAEERLLNIKGAFSASKSCKGKSFLLVDDVRTTGSTIQQCAKELKKCGAVRVYVITACCTLGTGDVAVSESMKA